MILKIIVFMTLIMVIYFIISNVGRQDSGCIAINGRQQDHEAFQYNAVQLELIIV